MHGMKRRVVVTGLGLITPLGSGTQKTWEGICKGASGIGRITAFDASDYPVQIAGQVKDFNPEDYIERKVIKKMDLFSQRDRERCPRGQSRWEPERRWEAA
jgi:3-oxoacyl-[acyl-carrier-protein] synthase II